MDNKQSLYTKYRPSNFNEVIGQNVAKDILINSIIKNKINHAYLFYGIRGTGKTTLARIFAKAINCKNLVNGNPCNECEMCESINNGSAFDIIEIDAASNNGVDEIRSIKENTSFSTTSSTYKVYIIDEVHMLTKQAFNALLKTLEEPPRNTIFLLATTEMNKIPRTVLSRTVTINLEVLSDSNIKEGLKVILNGENINFEEGALDYLVMISGGSLRDAISALEATLLFNDELSVKNVIKALGLIDKNEIKKFLQEDTNILIEKIDSSEKDPNKILLIVLEVLIELVKEGEYKFLPCLNSIITTASNIDDPSLLKLSLKVSFLNIDSSYELIKNNENVSHETLEENKNVENNKTIIKNSINEQNNIEKNSKNINISLSKETKNIDLPIEDSEKNSKNKNVENHKKKNDFNVINDFVNIDNYMYGIINNNSINLAKFIGKWRYIENYITNVEYKEIVSSLLNTRPLATADNLIIVGFSNKQQLNEFKRISLSKNFFRFIKEIIDEYIYILPINEENWKKLVLVKDNGYVLTEKNKPVDLEFKDFIENKETSKLKRIEDLFGEGNIVHE